MPDKDRRSQLNMAERSPKRSRAQVEPRTILGVFVLIIIAGPLLAVGTDIQSALASTQAFSWFSAGVMALLIVAAVVAAVLGEQ